MRKRHPPISILSSETDPFFKKRKKSPTPYPNEAMDTSVIFTVLSAVRLIVLVMVVVGLTIIRKAPSISLRMRLICSLILMSIDVIRIPFLIQQDQSYVMTTALVIMWGVGACISAYNLGIEQR